MNVFDLDWWGAWAIYALSLFNVALCLWLALTIWLNASGRTLGTWLSSFGFLVGALFWSLHGWSLDFALDSLAEAPPIWFAVAAAPVVGLPWGWMTLMLWYCGFWEGDARRLRRRVGSLFWAASAIGVVLMFLIARCALEVGTTPWAELDKRNTFIWTAVRVFLVGYPPFLVASTLSALWAISKPAPAGHWMRETSRRRARPYLVASSLVQLLLSLGVASALGWVAWRAQNRTLYNVAGEVVEWIDLVDAVLSLGVSLAIMLVGKAVTSFEIFTSKVLPRRGFWQSWRAVVIVAAIWSALVAAMVGFSASPVPPTLGATALLGVFLALFSRRVYLGSERALGTLAPFVASDHLLRSLLSGDEAALSSATDEPFRALCEDVLNASRAVLIPRASLASLFGPPRRFPPELTLQNEWLELAASAGSEIRSLPEKCGMDYLVPLGDSHSEGLGALLLGPREDGALYTLEEMNLARSVGEHLLDGGAGATLAARLVALQRQKVAHVATLDHDARRTLHDDVLPLLHSALLAPNEATQKIAEAHKRISDLLRERPAASPLENRGFWNALRHEAESEHGGDFDSIEWKVEDAARSWVETQPDWLQTTLFLAAREAIRNAARYGRGGDKSRALKLQIGADCGAGWLLWIEDDGVGSRHETPSQGSRSGLGLHAALLTVAGGTLSVDSGENGTRVTLRMMD